MKGKDKDRHIEVPLPKAIKIIEESICFIENHAKGRAGTGFVVGHGENKFFVATAAHVVDLKDRINNTDTTVEGNPSKSVRVWFADGYFDATFVLWCYELDIAVYKIESPRRMVPRVDIQNRCLLTGADVVACGFIGGTEDILEAHQEGISCRYLSFVRGIVSANIPTEWVDSKWVHQLDCTVYPGMSGGPVFTYYDGRPEVYGIVTTAVSVPIISEKVHHPLALAISAKHLFEGLTAFNVKIAEMKGAGE